MSDNPEEVNSIALRAAAVAAVMTGLTVAFYYIGSVVTDSIHSPLIRSYLIGAGVIFTVSVIYMMLEYIVNGPAKDKK